MKISFEKFEIDIEAELFSGIGSALLTLRKMDIEADAEEGKAHYAVKAAIVSTLAPVLQQLMESFLAQVAGAVDKGFPFPGFKPGLHPVDFGQPGAVPTDIQEWLRKRQEAMDKGQSNQTSKPLETCVECQIDGPHTLYPDRRVVRCMWCVAGVHLADRPIVGTLEYMDGPVAGTTPDPFEPDPAS